jgi:hypothetical protein
MDYETPPDGWNLVSECPTARLPPTSISYGIRPDDHYAIAVPAEEKAIMALS